MILVIDITKLEILSLLLLKAGRQPAIVYQKQYRGARSLLLRMIQFLDQRRLTLGKLKGLALVEGSGSFATVRQAVAILNTLALVRRTAIGGFDYRKYDSSADLLTAIAAYFKIHAPKRFLTPIYEGEPNINFIR